MSHLCIENIACPACGVQQELTLFRSLNGERVPAQVEQLLAGTFELRTCAVCRHAFRPEHRMLYAHVPARVWVVMYPLTDRPRFAMLEHGVGLLFAQTFASSPALITHLLERVRPRLVFGQHMLSESARMAHEGIDATTLECAKLLAYRRNLPALTPHGPVELCYEGMPVLGELRLGVHTLAEGRRVGELSVPGDLLDEATVGREAFISQYPALFTQPYISATRYLFGA
jgi:hypothetical protein